MAVGSAFLSVTGPVGLSLQNLTRIYYAFLCLICTSTG